MAYRKIDDGAMDDDRQRAFGFGPLGDPSE